MSDKYILNEVGSPEPCNDLLTWAAWYEKNRLNLHVGDDTVDDTRVSTVFLSLDHSFKPHEHVPILYETMVFKNGESVWMDRYCTREEAAAGHARTLERVRKGEQLE